MADIVGSTRAKLYQIISISGIHLRASGQSRQGRRFSAHINSETCVFKKYPSTKISRDLRLRATNGRAPCTKLPCARIPPSTYLTGARETVIDDPGNDVHGALGVLDDVVDLGERRRLADGGRLHGKLQLLHVRGDLVQVLQQLLLVGTLWHLRGGVHLGVIQTIGRLYRG